ncbi:hypothetical protein DMENIID0001_029140 [Sergentomyia squamirostris]
MEEVYFGWELLLTTISRDIRTDFDVLVALVHWQMSRNRFLCFGIGDDKTVADTEKGSELLPTDWNNQGDLIKLRYIQNGDLFILTALETQGTALFNLWSAKDEEVTNVQLKVEEVVKARTGTLADCFNDPPVILKKIMDDLLTEKAERERRAAEQRRQEEESRRRERELDRPRRDLYEDPLLLVNRRDPLGYGRGDLDPLGRLGGGNLFPGPGPFNNGIPNPGFGIPGGLPPGAVPPGARFDPFAPQPPNPLARPRHRGNHPDNDHLPPPDYDNMFM